jgi:hypothetical protein
MNNIHTYTKLIYTQIFDCKNCYSKSKTFYLNLKINIWTLNIVIQIWKLIFQYWKIVISILKIIFGLENCYSNSKTFYLNLKSIFELWTLLFKSENWLNTEIFLFQFWKLYLNLKIVIPILKHFIWISKS